MAKKIDIDGLDHVVDTEHGMIASIEASSTASKPYKTGARFYYQGKLYIATDDIPQGGTITPNTNCKLDKLGDDVTAQSEQITDLKTAITNFLSLNTWQGIVRTLRSGGTVPNGVEFSVPHAVYGNVEFVTRRMNVDKVADDPDAQTVTIQTKYLLSVNAGTSAATFQFDRAEAFASVETEIEAGSVVKFTLGAAYSSWEAGTYHFTATNAIPVGYKLGLSGNAGTALTSLKVNVYATAKDTSATAQYNIASGDGDATVNLGTFGTELNHSQRVSYGSNNDAESGILQWLNGITGNNAMDSIWQAKTKYDMMNTAFTTLKGFLGGFPEEFQNALKPCAVHNITNNVFEAQDSAYTTNSGYTKISKVWLPSRKEIYGTNENANEDSETQFPYYANIGTTDADKLMYAKGASSPTTYWLRTPLASYAILVRICYAPNGGALNYSDALSSTGVAPLGILA